MAGLEPSHKPQQCESNSTHLVLLHVIFWCCSAGDRRDTIEPVSISFLEVCPSAWFAPASPSLHKAVRREHNLGNLSHAELSDFRIHFFVTAPLAVTASVSCDNSSALQGHIKLLQGRLFYVLFLMPLRTGFMSKKIICHFQFLQHYSDKNQSLRKSLMSEVSWKQSNKYCSSRLVFGVLVVLPEISLTPSTLICQKNFVCWSFCVLPLLLFLFPLSPFSLSFLPKEMGANTSELLYHLYHSTICNRFHSSDDFTCNLIKRPDSLKLRTSKMYKALLDQSVLVEQLIRGCVWFLWESLSVSNG